MLIKKVVFLLHRIGMYITPFLWIVTKYILPFYLMVILSWYFNNNKCLITQIEYYYFNETFLGKGKKFYVPKIHRLILHLNFLIGLYYHSKKLISYLH